MNLYLIVYFTLEGALLTAMETPSPHPEHFKSKFKVGDRVKRAGKSQNEKGKV